MPKYKEPEKKTWEQGYVGTGVRPKTVPPVTPPPEAQASASGSYAIKSGDTLSAIAQSKGTTVQEIMSLNTNITNPNLIYAGQSLTLPGGEGGSGIIDYESFQSNEEATEIINADQEQDVQSASESEDPPVRKTTQDIMKEIETQVAPEVEKPVADFTESLEEYRTEYGVEGLETQLNDLRAQEEELQAIKRQRVASERGKTVAMNVIEGRVSETERQENERIDALNRTINSVTNQLNTKYNVIDTLMKTQEMDYNSSVASYDKEMASNISMFNTAKGIEEAEKTEIERERDNARSNAQIILNSYTSAGRTYDELTEPERTSLAKLGVESGLGTSFFQNVLKTSAGKDILTTIVSADDTKATILYKDGTTKTVSTGLPAKPISGTDISLAQRKTDMVADKGAGMPYKDAINLYSPYVGIDYVNEMYGIEDRKTVPAAIKDQEEKTEKEALNAEWTAKIANEKDDEGSPKYRRDGDDVREIRFGRDKVVYTFQE